MELFAELHRIDGVTGIMIPSALRAESDLRQMEGVSPCF